MADLIIPNLNIKTEKYIFKNKLNIRIKKTDTLTNIPKKLRIGLNKKVKFFNIFIPAFIAICSLILFSSSFIYFYSPFENIEKKELINPE